MASAGVRCPVSTDSSTAAITPITKCGCRKSAGVLPPIGGEPREDRPQNRIGFNRVIAAIEQQRAAGQPVARAVGVERVRVARGGGQPGDRGLEGIGLCHDYMISMIIMIVKRN